MEKLKSTNFRTFKLNEFDLSDKGIVVVEKSLNGVKTTLIEYDRIGVHPAYFVQRSSIALVGSVIFLICAVITFIVESTGKAGAVPHQWLIWLALMGISFAVYRLTQMKGYFLTSDYSNVILSGKMSEVEEFLKEFNTTKQQSILSGVKKRKEAFDEAEVERYLLALWAGSVVTEAQYDGLRKDLGLVGDFKPKVGFSV
jgi:FlaA1/EpsC-like NDP-sugar epimerase